MGRPEIQLTRMSYVFRQAVISFKANIRVLLVIAALSAMYNNAVDSSIGLLGFSYNSSHGNFSLDLDLQGKQNHKSLDATPSGSHQQKLFVDGNNNGIGTRAESGEGPLYLENFLSSFLLSSPVGEVNRHVKDFAHHTNDVKFSNNLMEGNSEKTLNALTETQKIPREDPIDGADSTEGIPQLNVRMVFPLKNDTQDEVHDDFDESEVGIFAGRLFAGRGFDRQGAMPEGTSDTVFLVLFLLLGVLATLLVVVALQHSAVLGAVTYTVVSTYMNRRVSIRRSVRSGLRTGMWRLIGIAILHGVCRALQSLFLMNFLFGKVLEAEQMQKLVFQLSIMPCPLRASWHDDYAKTLGMSIRIAAFVAFDYLFDAVTYSIYIMACWVSIVENRQKGAELFIRAWNLVKCMPFQVTTVKIIESILCGISFKWLLQQVVGHFVSMLLLSLLETFFLVLWLVLYFSARWKESQGQSRRFSVRDLEDFLERLK
eukprot:TRINITY_DN5089_c0_g2_i4.p1 TRINITY_DN5089_c0_g2~~TRINITY_DN5089_c0_g2_i4.p1  ORF type:complete len:484 (+),score=81.90 TRINITY_DN5089_c0_g2_i4:302-1753(+)